MWRVMPLSPQDVLLQRATEFGFACAMISGNATVAIGDAIGNAYGHNVFRVSEGITWRLPSGRQLFPSWAKLVLT